METRISKEPPETPQRSIMGTPRRTNPQQGSIGIGEGVERMVGVTSVNLGGIEVDVEDVADRLRRLKVLPPSPYIPIVHVLVFTGRSEKPRQSLHPDQKDSHTLQVKLIPRLRTRVP